MADGVAPARKLECMARPVPAPGAVGEVRSGSLAPSRGLEAGAFPAALWASVEDWRRRVSPFEDEASAEVVQPRAMTSGGALDTLSAPEAGPWRRNNKSAGSRR